MNERLNLIIILLTVMNLTNINLRSLVNDWRARGRRVENFLSDKLNFKPERETTK